MSNRSIGMILLAIWFLVYGAIAVLGLTFAGMPILMGILAILIGILLLVGR